MRIESRAALAMAAVVTVLAFGATMASAATSNGSQVIETFDGLDASWNGGINVDGIDTQVSGGSILTQNIDLDPRFPPASGQNVYGGTHIIIQLDDPFCCSYPAFGARVTGLGAVTLSVYWHDYLLDQPVFYAKITTAGANFIGSGAAPNALLTIANAPPGAILTRAEFSSADWFTIDDLTLGLPDVMPGIPEPASWALMIAGFGAIGMQLRRRMPISAARSADRPRG